MIRRLLGLVFNRWVLAAVLLLALAVLIWTIGPLVAVGTWRPLDSERARWITLGVIAVLAVGMAAWRVWRARRGNEKVVAQLIAAPAAGAAESADLAAVRQRFEGALATLKKARFGQGGGTLDGLKARFQGRYLYELPWYMIIGAPGSGKTTALRHSGLNFPLAGALGDDAVRGVGGTRNCDWWFTDQAVLIDTAGRFTTQDSDKETDRATWSGFLGLLRRSRPRQPLNGVLITVSITDLIARTPAERVAHAAAVRQRLQELHEQLQVRLPIYLLVTKVDLLAGFADTFAAVDQTQRESPWGFTFAMPPKPVAGQPAHAAFGAEFDLLQQRLVDGLIDRLQAENDVQRRARIYGFPGQFAGLKGVLQEFIQAVFAPSPYEADPLLRGVYFVSGTQEGTPIDRMLGAIARSHALESAILPPQKSSGRSYFLTRLLREVVFAEQGLAGTNLRWERRRHLLALGGYAAIAVLAAAALAAWFVSASGNRAYIDTVAARADEVKKLVQETPNRASPDLLPILPALAATRNLAVASRSPDDAAVPWSLGFGLYQGRKLDTAARQAYERMLTDAVLPRLALRVAEQLAVGDQQETQYEALKAYLMMYDPQRFDAAALKAYFERDWDAQLGKTLEQPQRDELVMHLDNLLAQGPAVSPLAMRKELVDVARQRLAAVPLPQRIYNRMRQQGLGSEFPEFTIARAAGGNAPLVFVRTSGTPLTRGVPGLFSFDGYHKGFQREVGKVAQQLAEEQGWVLGIADAPAAAALPGDDTLTDAVRRIYLNEYADTWDAFIKDLRLVPVTSMATSMQTTRILAAPDSPLLPLMKAMSRETTLLAGTTGVGAIDKATDTVSKVLQTSKEKLVGSITQKPATVTTGAPGKRIESIVDDRFIDLRRLVTAPEGGKAPIEGIQARLGELQVMLVAADTALKGGAAPPASPLPGQLVAEGDNAPEPIRTMLKTLGTASKGIASIVLRDTLARDVKATVGDFCQSAIAGRYPFDRHATRDVQPADFTTLFGPGGKFEQMAQRFGPYVDTSQWTFRTVDGVSLGSDRGTLTQFQRAARIRETFFGSGAGPGGTIRLEFKPVEMDPALTQFVLDVDGQIVRYAHGPQIPTSVQWPGPRGSNQVRVQVAPSGSTGMVADGPWALFRLFERVQISPGGAPEKFRATFDVDGRKAVFDVTAASVRNPFRMQEMKEFACPGGL